MGCLGTRIITNIVNNYINLNYAVEQVQEDQQILSTSFAVCKMNGVVWVRKIHSGYWEPWEKHHEIPK